MGFFFVKQENTLNTCDDVAICQNTCLCFEITFFYAWMEGNKRLINSKLLCRRIGNVQERQDFCKSTNRTMR